MSRDRQLTPEQAQAELDRLLAAGNHALNRLIDSAAADLASGVTPETLTAMFVLDLGEWDPDSLIGMAALAVTRLARQHRRV